MIESLQKNNHAKLVTILFIFESGFNSKLKLKWFWFEYWSRFGCAAGEGLQV